jgi:hypothetical protein
MKNKDKITLPPIDGEKEPAWIDKARKENLKSNKQDRKERKKYAKAIVLVPLFFFRDNSHYNSVYSD